MEQKRSMGITDFIEMKKLMKSRFADSVCRIHATSHLMFILKHIEPMINYM